MKFAYLEYPWGSSPGLVPGALCSASRLFILTEALAEAYSRSVAMPSGMHEPKVATEAHAISTVTVAVTMTRLEGRVIHIAAWAVSMYVIIVVMATRAVTMDLVGERSSRAAAETMHALVAVNPNAVFAVTLAAEWGPSETRAAFRRGSRVHPVVGGSNAQRQDAQQGETDKCQRHGCEKEKTWWTRHLKLIQDIRQSPSGLNQSGGQFKSNKAWQKVNQSSQGANWMHISSL